MSTKRGSRRPSKLPEGEDVVIPPPPPTRPEGLGRVIEAGTPEPGSAEDYYKRIHASRTLLAMQAVEVPVPTAASVVIDDASAPSPGASALLKRVFAAEKETATLHQQLAEIRQERDSARAEARALRDKLGNVRAALDGL